MAYVVTDTDRRILHSFVVFPFLTIRQMVWLHFHPGSTTYASTRLRRLFLAELLQRQALPSLLQAGSVPWIYSLSARGRHYLRHHGTACAYPHAPARLHRLTDYEDLRHDVGVTDVLISGMVFARQTPELHLVRAFHDRTLRARGYSPVVFDGWLTFWVGEHEQMCIAIEYERTIKDTAAFQQKIIGLLELLAPTATGKSMYEEQFGTTSITIAYITAVRGRYVLTMKQRIEQVLQTSQKTYEADVFRLLSVPFYRITPEIFVQRVWYRPFSPELVSLGGGR